MKKILWLVLMVVGMAACTEYNAPTNNSGTTDSGSGEANDTTDNDVNNQVWSDTLYISWSGSNATVTGSIDSITVTNENGYVTVNSAVTRLVTYVLSGNGTGQISIYGSVKEQIVLNGLTLTCSDGPAINNQCHKKCYVVVNGTNSLTDGSSYASSTEDRKAAFFSEGQLIFSGSGTLTVKGNYKHAIASDDYIHLTSEAGTFVLNAASDGLHANDALYISGGTTTITAGSDGVQCDSTITIAGGALTITADADGIQSDTTNIVISGGEITITKAGDKGIVAFGNVNISGGTIRVTSQYKCIKAGKKENNTIISAGNITISDGDIQLICTGTSSSSGGRGGWGGSSSSDSSTPEGMEAKGTITISGGTIYVQSSDDAINAAGDLTISGGCVMAYSTGNDGIDSNGNTYIKGGVVYAIGSSSPEVAIDANTEGGKQLYVQGGTLVAIGGLESGASLSQSCYSASSWSKNTWYALTVGSDVFAFKTPSSGGSGLVVSGASTPTLKSGVTVSGTAIFNGMGYYPASASGGSSVSLSSYSGGNSGGPGGNPGGGGGHGPGGW